MHTLKTIAAGLSLLTLCTLTGKRLGGDRGRVKGALVFVPLWAIGTGLNLYNGVAHAGYTVSEELPVAAGVFAVPALAAAVIARRQ